MITRLYLLVGHSAYVSAVVSNSLAMPCINGFIFVFLIWSQPSWNNILFCTLILNFLKLQNARQQRKKRRLEDFDTDGKIALIQTVCKNRILWDMDDKRHFDGLQVKKSWQVVGDSLGKNGEISLIVNLLKNKWIFQFVCFQQMPAG